MWRIEYLIHPSQPRVALTVGFHHSSGEAVSYLYTPGFPRGQLNKKKVYENIYIKLAHIAVNENSN
jgi:hypothetical protein